MIFLYHIVNDVNHRKGTERAYSTSGSIYKVGPRLAKTVYSLDDTVITYHSNCLSRARNGQYMCVRQFLRVFFFHIMSAPLVWGQGVQITYCSATIMPRNTQKTRVVSLLYLLRVTLPSASEADERCFSKIIACSQNP